MSAKKSILFLFLFCFKLSVRAERPANDTVVVKVRVFESDRNEITPVMVCITNLEDSSVRVPPDGAVAGIPTEIPYFLMGVPYSSDKNWVGPIRMTNGQGNNENRSSLYNLKPSLPYWREPIMYQTSGDFSIKLTPGKWRISLEHGSEFLPISEDFTVPRNVGELTKTYTFQRWINLPARGWYSGDVHVHHPTDKPEYKEYLLHMGKAEDVHIINMLEMGHHLGTDFKVDGFGKQFRKCMDNYCLISGQEDPRTEIGHIIGLNINKQVRDTSKYYYYDLVFKKLRLQPDAIIGYAHFAWKGFGDGFPWHITTNEIDFVELLQFLRLNTADYYDYLNLGFKITAAAGSDFPWASTIGDVRTFVYTGKNFSVDNWFSALKAGNTFVSNGPAIFFKAGSKLPGTIIAKKGASKSRLQVTALSNEAIGVIDRVAIYNNEGLVSEATNPKKLDSISIDITHAITKSQWIAAVVYCENGAVAHTTPVYYVVNGEPTYDKERAPGIIEKQVVFIEKIRKQELAKEKADKGILERLDKADLFYEKLLKEVTKGK
ncbi:MAG: CehA/McbA family metallohydrolase [Ginsengibacter sp.]